MKLNCGCGQYLLTGWCNVDEDPATPADAHYRIPPLPMPDGTVEEIYAGHFLEHLERQEADLFLAECFRVLEPGGRLGIVVPDTRLIMKRWLAGEPDAVEVPRGEWHDMKDLDEVCKVFLYGRPEADPRHRWSWEVRTLARAMHEAGFLNLQEIDRYRFPLLAAPAWFQCGIQGIKPKDQGT